MNYSYPRQVNFESIYNFRDLGGYHTTEGNKVAWRKLFRSGNLNSMTGNDFHRLKEELGLSSVLDLRSNFEIEQQGIGLLSNSDIKYYNISLISDGGDEEANRRRYQGLSDMGELYTKLTRQKDFGQLIIESLEIIAESTNHPLVFHCSAGKDRTGILAAIILSILRVADEDIVNDYCLSAPYSEILFNRVKIETRASEEVKSLPDYFWKVAPKSMLLLLTMLKQEYGSVREYLKVQGANDSLFKRLEKVLST
jgi:protein-tyrosine phosphatase